MFVPNRDWARHLLSYRVLNALGASSLAETLREGIDTLFKHHHLYDEDGWRQVPRGARLITRTILRNSLQAFCMTEGLPTADSGFPLSDEDRPSPRAIVPPRQNNRSFRRLKRLAAGAFGKAGYRVVAPSVTDRLWHAVGTARMGLDPATSIVDPRGEAHDVRGLFVVDASIIPTAGAVNGTLTIIALAIRSGEAAIVSGA